MKTLGCCIKSKVKVLWIYDFKKKKKMAATEIDIQKHVRPTEQIKAAAPATESHNVVLPALVQASTLLSGNFSSAQRVDDEDSFVKAHAVIVGVSHS